ncbi:MAG: glycosyltransferase family 4 protein [Chloroflexota bacterium]
MKILMLSWEYPPYIVGGLGRHVAELVPALAQLGIEVHVVTPVLEQDHSSTTVENGVTVHRVPKPTVDDSVEVYEQALRINQALENYLVQASQTYGRYQLIHTHDWLTGFAAIALQRAWNCPLVTTIHATERGRNQGHLPTPLQQAIDRAEGELVHQAQRTIVCSRHMSTEVQYFFQLPPHRLDVVPNGVNVLDLQNGSSPAELSAFRARYAPADSQIVFTISRLVYEKGIHLLVQAAPLVLQDCPRARIIIAGTGPEEKNLKQQAKNLGVADQVDFIGYVSDAERNLFLEAANCAIFPSLYEPFGIVALEAMALGCPLVVSDVGGFSEVVKHGETGIKIYPNNVDSTAWGIIQALTHPEWVKEQTIAARQSVEALYNWPRIAALTADVYQQVRGSHLVP